MAGHGASVYDLAFILQRSIRDISQLRATGACSKGSGRKNFAALFQLWHGREPEEGDWPPPRKVRPGEYEWQAPELALLASLVGRLIAHHHAHCRVPVAWRFHTGIYNGRTLLGVALVGNPVAPALTGRAILEVNRLCIRRDTAAALRWNAASMLYGWCAREAARRGWRKIITYTRANEPGTSIRAAGWKMESRVRGRGWHSARRARSNTNSWIDKIRWARDLVPTASPSRAPRSACSDDRSILHGGISELSTSWWMG